MFGISTYSVYSPSGELLGEYDPTGSPLRRYVYLDSEPLAEVVASAGLMLRFVGGTGCSATGVGSGLGILLLCSVGVALYRRRRPYWAAGLMAMVVVGIIRCAPSGEEKKSGSAAAGRGLGGAVQSSGFRPTPGPIPSPRHGGGGSGGPGITDPTYYFHNDRLGRPIRMTDATGALVWRASYRPFGDVERIETDPNNTGTATENNLRFPGQYDDSLLTLLLSNGPYYNWNRYYDPGLGRYLQPDPLLSRASCSIR